MTRGFVLGSNVTENVRALRKALGSVSSELSFAKFAAELVKQGARATLNATTVYDWTKGAEPDLVSIRVMATIAGCSFEDFALGRGDETALSIEDGEKVADPAPRKRREAASPTARRRGVR